MGAASNGRNEITNPNFVVPDEWRAHWKAEERRARHKFIKRHVRARWPLAQKIGGTIALAALGFSLVAGVARIRAKAMGREKAACGAVVPQ